MKNSIKVFMYICLIGLLSACSFKQKSLEINHYAIDFKHNSNTFKNTSKSIYIEEPSVNNSFNSYSIFYTIKAYLFEEYALNKWINKPSYMIHNNLIDSFESSNMYKTVFKKESKRNVDYLLRTNIMNLYNSIENDKSYAILKIKFDLEINKEGIRTFTYNKKILSKSNTPYGFVIALNQAFEEVVNDLILQLNQSR